jgi:hypothetical protein
LLEYGYDAIPQLAAALDDQRLTRSVGFWRVHFFSHKVLTVGDAAEQILNEIAGRRFDPAERYENQEARIADVRTNALAWHAQLLSKGERPCLIEAVEQGDRTSVELAHRLLEKYPDDACLAILSAISRAEEDHRRREFVELLGSVASDAPVCFLLAELKHETVSLRLAAAEALTKLDRPEGVVAMLNEWGTSKKIDQLQGVGPFLVRQRQIDMLEAVVERFSEPPIDERMEILDEAMPDDLELLAAQPALREAVIRLLVVALRDTEVRTGMSMGLGSKSISDPRVCDLAGYHLNCLDPAAFRFDLGAPLERREVARWAILEAGGGNPHPGPLPKGEGEF